MEKRDVNHAYIKQLDPFSTVRDGEEATTENTRGIPDSVRQAYNENRNLPESSSNKIKRLHSKIKELDPQSSIREGEEASIETARGVPKSIIDEYNNTLKTDNKSEGGLIQHVTKGHDYIKDLIK